MSFGLLLLCLGNVVVVILTSPDRLGSEGPLLGVLCVMVAVLAFGITDRVWYSNTRLRAEGD